MEATCNCGNTDSTLLIGLLTILFTSPFLFTFYRYISSEIERGYRYPEWAAVFLSSGQVYFGKIKKLTRDDIRIENIYYLSADEFDKWSRGDKNKDKFSIVKLGKEIHGPEDFMLLNRQHIVFLESLTEQSEVVRAIKSMESMQK